MHTESPRGHTVHNCKNKCDKNRDTNGDTNFLQDSSGEAVNFFHPGLPHGFSPLPVCYFVTPNFSHFFVGSHAWIFGANFWRQKLSHSVLGFCRVFVASLSCAFRCVDVSVCVFVCVCVRSRQPLWCRWRPRVGVWPSARPWGSVEFVAARPETSRPGLYDRMSSSIYIGTRWTELV